MRVSLSFIRSNAHLSLVCFRKCYFHFMNFRYSEDLNALSEFYDDIKVIFSLGLISSFTMCRVDTMFRVACSQEFII